MGGGGGGNLQKGTLKKHKGQLFLVGSCGLFIAGRDWLSIQTTEGWGFYRL